MAEVRWALGALLLTICTLTWADPDNPVDLTVGFVELEGDPRYRTDSAYTGIVFRDLGRPFAGAELGLADAQTIGQVMGVDFKLQHRSAPSVAELSSTVDDWVRDRGVGFVLTDLPAEALLELADASRELPVLFFNISAPDDRLRRSDCRANIAHVFPSHSMLTDGLVQHLVTQQWRELLVLQGEQPEDALWTEALRGSADKFGARVVESRLFVVNKDPRNRDQNNIALLTAEADYDTVFVADSSGEFDRYVPYQTRLPRPVVGTAGLRPLAWHWSWHRHGAPQLQHRFEEAAMPRRMNSESWAAWVAIKAVSQAVLRASPEDWSSMRQFILSDRLNLDGVKGTPSSFRSWNQQLRQPLLLATPNAVVQRLPLRKFLHGSNTLDTLGADRTESQCALAD